MKTILLACAMTASTVGFHKFAPMDSAIINIGSFVDPPTPFNRTAVIAFEARYDAASKIAPLENRYIIAAAVGTTFGITPFFQHGTASSMLRFTNARKATTVKRKKREHLKFLTGLGKGSRSHVLLVPSIPIAYILENVDMVIWFLKTGEKYSKAVIKCV